MAPELPASGYPSGYIGPDGTADPAPQPLFPDPLAGLVGGSMPSAELDMRSESVFDSGLVARPPLVQGPDSEALRAAVDAVLADESAPTRPLSQRRQVRRDTHQPGMIPPGQRRSSSDQRRPGGVPPATQQRPALRRPGQAARKQPAVVIIFVIFAIVVLFIVVRALFEWLGSLFS